jgi:hypothetical protein
MQNEGKFDSLLDGQQLSEDNDQPETQAEPTHSDEAQTEPEVLHVRAKRKRRKPSTIESELEVIDTDGAEA